MPRDLQQPLAWGSPPNLSLSSGSSKSTAGSASASSSGAKPRTRLRSRHHSELQTSTSLVQQEAGTSSAMLSLRKDPQKLLDLVKNASTRMDAKARRRPTRVASRGGITRRNSTMAVTSGNSKGKEKEVIVEDLGERNGKMSTVKRLKRNDSSSTSSSSIWVDCDNDSASPSSVHMDASMDIDTGLQLMEVDEELPKDPAFGSGPHCPTPPPPRTRTQMLPPPIPKSKSSSPTNPLSSNATSSHTPRLVVNSSQERASPKTGPLVKQERQKDPTPSIPPPAAASRIPPPLAAPPRPSQPSKHPPPLGMRGALTRASSSPFAPSQTLPAKQKGFKPPLLSQNTSVSRLSQVQVQVKLPPPAKSIPSLQLGRTPSEREEDDEEEDSHQSKSRSRSSSPPAGADSSFEYNVSFEIDPDALEETLQKYD